MDEQIITRTDDGAWREEVNIVEDIIKPSVMKARANAAMNFNVTDPDSWFMKYKGLCDYTIDMLYCELKAYCDKHNIIMTFTKIHGEQRHSPKTPRKEWTKEHTWALVEFSGPSYSEPNHTWSYYIDPTSSQFQDLYDDIPDYYISTDKPKWYYPDRDNMALNGWTKKLNEKIYLKVRAREDLCWVATYHYGIVEFWQYEVWGRISDFIRFFKKK